MRNSNRPFVLSRFDLDRKFDGKRLQTPTFASPIGGEISGWRWSVLFVVVSSIGQQCDGGDFDKLLAKRRPIAQSIFLHIEKLYEFPVDLRKFGQL